MLMKISNFIKKTPWDSKVFGINTFEIVYNSEEKEILNQVLKKIVSENQVGHYTIKVNPLFCKNILHEYGFYYCDTLIEPYCNSENLMIFNKEGISLLSSVPLEELVKISNSAFAYGRFHRDFKINKNQADSRYNSWLKELYQEKKVWGIMYYEELAGFWGFSKNKIVLHALSNQYRGRGMAKYFWSKACQQLFSRGYSELTSSISAANLAVLNLYSSLGFKFRNSVDVYHLLIE